MFLLGLKEGEKEEESFFVSLGDKKVEIVEKGEESTVFFLVFVLGLPRFQKEERLFVFEVGRREPKKERVVLQKESEQ